MKIPLQVSYDAKDEFKRLCKTEKIPFFWNPKEKTWEIEGTEVPECLQCYTLADIKNKIHIIDCDFAYMPFAKLAGARWDKVNKVVTFQGSLLPPALTGFHPKSFSFGARIEKKLNNSAPQTLLASKPINLYPHQKTAEVRILEAWRVSQPGFLLADETGLGKTIATWGAIQKIGETIQRPLKILVVGPLNSLETWRETIYWMGYNLPHDILLLNYEKLKNLFEEEGNRAKSLKGIAKFGTIESFDITVFDESHYLKSPTAARSKLARKVEENSRFCIWISATAGQNPLELSYLANLLANKTNNKKSLLQKDFETWCQAQGIKLQRGKFGKWIWEGQIEDNKKLHDILFGKQTHALRRRCSDIEGWPEIQRIPKPYHFTPAERSLYNTQWKEFLLALEQEKHDRQAGNKETTKGLVLLLRLRQKASLLRVPHSCALALELLQNGYQVAISVEFLQSLDAIRKILTQEGISCSEYSGRNRESREQERKKYQGGHSPVILFSTESSISLHQEQKTDPLRSQINHDLRWSAIEQEQIDGRSHRNGTHAPTYWCFAKNSIEEKVAEILLNKLENMNTLRGDNLSFADIYSAILK